MKVVREGLTAIVSKSEYDQGVGREIPNLYVVGEDYSFYKRALLAEGGHCLLKVKELPKMDPDPTTTEQINFLPGGKVPLQFLNQIISFFKKVMETNLGGAASRAGDNCEAMTHILWNTETRQYEIGIPKQTVGRASVSHDLTYIDHSKQVVIVDIHSHNTMGAFFSGTDDNDDRKGCWFAGVVGGLDKDTIQLKFRFTLFGEFRDMGVSDIFDHPAGEPLMVTIDLDAVPQAWMEKVSGNYVSTATTGYNYGYGTGYQDNRGSWNQGRGRRGGNNGRRIENDRSTGNSDIPSWSNGNTSDLDDRLHALYGGELDDDDMLAMYEGMWGAGAGSWDSFSRDLDRAEANRRTTIDNAVSATRSDDVPEFPSRSDLIQRSQAAQKGNQAENDIPGVVRIGDANYALPAPTRPAEHHIPPRQNHLPFTGNREPLPRYQGPTLEFYVKAKEDAFEAIKDLDYPMGKLELLQVHRALLERVKTGIKNTGANSVSFYLDMMEDIANAMGEVNPTDEVNSAFNTPIILSGLFMHADYDTMAEVVNQTLDLIAAAYPNKDGTALDILVTYLEDNDSDLTAEQLHRIRSLVDDARVLNPPTHH